jgi:hypothetical protein
MIKARIYPGFRPQDIAMFVMVLALFALSGILTGYIKEVHHQRGEYTTLQQGDWVKFKESQYNRRVK